MRYKLGVISWRRQGFNCVRKDGNSLRKFGLRRCKSAITLKQKLKGTLIEGKKNRSLHIKKNTVIR